MATWYLASTKGWPDLPAAIDAIEALGIDVVDPFSPEKERIYRERGMDGLFQVVGGCDAVAFAPLEDGVLTAGVAAEAQRAIDSDSRCAVFVESVSPLVLRAVARLDGFDVLGIEESRAARRRWEVSGE